MRYYLKELKLPRHWDKNNLYEEMKTVNFFFCEDGEYQMIKNRLHKYKFMKYKKDDITPQYIEDYTLLSSGEKLLYNTFFYRLPYEHISQDIQVYTYKLHPQSTTEFIIEKNKDKVVDFYFESPHASHQHTLIEDITSFLSYIK